MTLKSNRFNVQGIQSSKTRLFHLISLRVSRSNTHLSLLFIMFHFAQFYSRFCSILLDFTHPLLLLMLTLMLRRAHKVLTQKHFDIWSFPMNSHNNIFYIYSGGDILKEFTRKSWKFNAMIRTTQPMNSQPFATGSSVCVSSGNEQTN